MISTSLSLHQFLSHISSSESAEEWSKGICSFVSQLSGSSLTTLYRIPKTQNNRIGKSGRLYLHAQIGHTTAPKYISAGADFLQATVACEGAVVQNSPEGPFKNLLLNENMQSGIAVLLYATIPFRGLLIANYTAPYHYTGSSISLFEQIRTLVKYTPQGPGGKT